MCKFIRKLYIKHLNEKVEKFWDIYRFDMEPNHTSHNNEGDAFKHCYMSAELTMWLGRTIANWIGVKHEDNNPYNTPEERAMDLHNNLEGQKIGKYLKSIDMFWMFKKYDYWIAIGIMDAMRDGKLIVKP